MGEIRQNPFQDRGQWYWRNEAQNVNGPYATQTDALLGLLRHLDKRTWGRKFVDLFKELIAA